MQSEKAGRGNRTTDKEGYPSTVGVDLHTHTLRDNTRCNLYDLAGELDFKGLHRLFLAEWALYIVVFKATDFEGKQDKELTTVRTCSFNTSGTTVNSGIDAPLAVNAPGARL